MKQEIIDVLNKYDVIDEFYDKSPEDIIEELLYQLKVFKDEEYNNQKISYQEYD